MDRTCTVDLVPEELQDILEDPEMCYVVLPENTEGMKYVFHALSDGRVAVIAMKAGE